jgi:predicted AlkP superfamily phosphohydrolase/phosphomutase
MSQEARSRTVLIGLDGATFSVLDPLMQDGVMPYLKQFAAEGVRGIMRSTAHPLTPPAWASLMTGRTPGNHGVFDFVRVDRQRNEPTYTLVTSADIQCETVWSIVSREGCRVTALNFPCMFPPPQINGFVVPGYVPWSYLSRAVHPRELYTRLKTQQGFNARELAVDWHLERKAVQGLPEDDLQSWVEFHVVREQRWFEITKFLMREEPCDLTAVLFDGVDRLQHLCFHLIDPYLASQATGARAQHVRNLCLDYFRQVDGYIREIVSMAGPEARVFITSDHGFTVAGDQIFYANTWLQQHGYLEWAEGVPVDEEGRLALDDNTESNRLLDWSRTKAFALTSSSNAISILQAEGPDEPGVPAAEYEAFRERLVKSLLEFTDPRTGEPVIAQVMTREEAFPGQHMDQAPDLTLVLREPGFLSVLRADAPLKPRPMPYGTHHPHGIFFGRGPGIRAGEEVPSFSIVDISPTLLYSLGLPVPGDMEGAPNLNAFEASFVNAHPVMKGALSFSQSPSQDKREGELLPEDEEARIIESLKVLGYFE